jgi:hypothetical protein
VYVFSSISDSVTLDVLPEATVNKLIKGQKIKNLNY